MGRNVVSLLMRNSKQRKNKRVMVIVLEGIGDDVVCDVVRCDDLKVMFAIRIAWTRELIE